MGAGASNSRRPPPVPTPEEIAALGQPYHRGAFEACYYCLPYDEEVKKRISVVVLEVGPLGFRMLRPDSTDCLFAYPWGQIHSWAHKDNRFSFRFFDDGKKKVVQYVLYLRDMEELLRHIQVVIDSILSERKNSAIPESRLADLFVELEALRSSPCPASPIDLLSTHYTNEYYFWANQGRQIIDTTPSSFDKVEVAVLLHGRLIDQNRFSFVLEGLESQADRDNVWHRITVQKKAAASTRNSTAAAVTISTAPDSDSA